MARKFRSPQQKKRLSLRKDRRNTYGENDKASRKAIPANKARSHRAVRRTSKVAVTEALVAESLRADTAQSTLKTPRLQKGKWRKYPDTPLGKVVARQLKRRRHLSARHKVRPTD